jgi:hypothetical protein
MQDIDIAGHKVKPVTAGAVVIGSAAAIWFAVRQRKAAASSSTSPDAIDPLTGLPYSQDQTTDPLTGESYLAEAQEYGSVSAAEQAVAGESSLDFSSEYGAAGSVGSTGTTTAGTTAGTTYASNAAWAQAVTSGLSAIGYTPSDVSAALGLYLGSLPETAAQAGIVNTALAEYGPPPAGSYTIILAAATGPAGSGTGTATGTGTGTTGTGSGTAPPPGGGPITNIPGNFRVTGVSGLSVSLAWSPVTVPPGQGPLRGYTVAYGQSAGSLPYTQALGPASTSTTITFNSGAGSKGLTHYFEVWADPADTNGPHAGPISAKTQ